MAAPKRNRRPYSKPTVEPVEHAHGDRGCDVCGDEPLQLYRSVDKTQFLCFSCWLADRKAAGLL